MKLSKQERIGALVIAVIVILAVGIFMFIKPRAEAIGVSKSSLENKQSEYTAAVEKAATKDTLKEQVMQAFEDGEDLADVFFEEMTSYEADEEFRNFLAQCKANVVVGALTVTEPSVTTLGVEFFEEDEVTYALKSYATSGTEPSQEQLAYAQRQQILRDNLSSTQEVGSITVSFDVTAIDQEELIKFCDEVNNYQKQESAGLTRKAMKLEGFVFSNPLAEKMYDELMDDIAKDAEEEGIKQLYKRAGNGKTPPAAEAGAAGAEGAEGDQGEELSVSDYIYTVSTSVTFYSVTRMEDPTDQLDAQDGIAF